MAHQARRRGGRLVLEIAWSALGNAAPGDERYEREPRLALIETYALDVIGELSAEEVREAADATAGLLGDGADWRGSVRRDLGWDALVDADIAESWVRLRARARREGGEPDPADFARRFADEVVRLSRT